MAIEISELKKDLETHLTKLWTGEVSIKSIAHLSGVPAKTIMRFL